MKVIDFYGNKLSLDVSGVLFWPLKKIAIVSDLHLEKSSYLAKRGNFLPPYESFETLKKLRNVLKKKNIKQLILLGDVFHDNYGYERLENSARDLFNKIIIQYNARFILGNHDKNINIPNLKTLKKLKINNINLTHQLTQNLSIEITGHYHPKVVLLIQGNKISKSCFIVSGKKIILPAFGKFTGGLNVESNTFDKILDSNCDYYLIDNSKIYHFRKDNKKKKLTLNIISS
ncbi:MAG: hypothetical protein CMP34_03215 [Rickettsiales bacterium]|nr:hypothetical protein [Rickettsiales bacterium]